MQNVSRKYLSNYTLFERGDFLGRSTRSLGDLSSIKWYFFFLYAILYNFQFAKVQVNRKVLRHKVARQCC